MSAASGAMYMKISWCPNTKPCGTPVSTWIRRAGSPLDERSTASEIYSQPIQRCTCEAVCVPQSVNQHSMVDAFQSGRQVEDN